MQINQRALLRSGLAGVATGGRSTAALGVLAVSRPEWLPAEVRDLAAFAPAAVGVELLLDKMPFAHSRLGLLGLGARLGAAATAGALLASRSGDADPALAAGIACAAALVSARAGHDLRVRCGGKLRGLLGALAEDAFALGCATAAVSLV